MSTYQQSSVPDPFSRGSMGRNRRPVRRGTGPSSSNDLFRRRMLAVVMLGALLAPVVWALRGDNNAVDSTPTGGAAVVVGFSPSDSAATDPATVDSSNESLDTLDPGDTVAAPGTELVADEATVAPVAVTEVPATTALAKKVCANSYTVQAGDSWYGIAARAGVKASLIAGANNRTIRSALMVGQVICLPAGAVVPAAAPTTVSSAPPTTAKPVCSNTYTVVAGDSWYGIAAKTGARTSDLTAVNSMTLRSMLHVGDKICLPAGAKAPAAPAATTAPSNGGSNAVSVRRYSRTELEAIVRAAWPDDMEETAFFVIQRESNWNNLSQNSCCVGIFQLNFNAHKSWMKNYGVTDRSQLLDPEVNARLALVTWNRSGSWKPWCTNNWCPTE